MITVDERSALRAWVQARLREDGWQAAVARTDPGTSERARALRGLNKAQADVIKAVFRVRRTLGVVPSFADALVLARGPAVARTRENPGRRRGSDGRFLPKRKR